MALADLLWACPECGEDGGLTPDGAGHRCRACGTLYQRGRGAAIRATRPDGSERTQRPAEWLEAIPDPETLVRQRDTDGSPIRTARVDTRWVVDSERVRDADGYLNRVEIWGEASPAVVELRPDRLVFTPTDGRPETWPLESLTAVQASSSTLQLNRKGAPLVSFRFHDDSIFLWERLLHATLRDFYARTGRGAIVEFQPRIVTG